MTDDKEHGPHPFALLREWKLAIKRTLQAHAKSELEYYKLAEFMDCLLVFSPMLDAGKVSFKATFAQIQELHNDVTRKSIYNRAERLKEMGIILSWEQPEAEKKGEFNPTVWTVSKISGGNKHGGEKGEGKKEGVPEGKEDWVPGVKDRVARVKDAEICLLSRICGLIPVQEGVPTCDTGLFPWLRRCESHRIVWSPLESCC